ERLFGLERQSSLIERLGLLPVSLAFVESAQRRIKPGITGRDGDGLFVVPDSSRRVPQGLLHLGEQDEAAQVLLVELEALQEGRFRIGRLLCADQDLALEEVEGGIIRVCVDFLLDELNRVRGLSTLKVEFHDSLDGVEEIRRMIEGFAVKRLGFRITLCEGAKLPQLGVAQRILRRNLN